VNFKVGGHWFQSIVQRDTRIKKGMRGMEPSDMSVIRRQKVAKGRVFKGGVESGDGGLAGKNRGREKV